MKKNLALSLLFTAFVGALLGQTQYPKGCYMSLEELQSKTPSVQYELDILERTTGEIRMNGGNDYKPVSPDKSVKKKVIKKQIYAISDGDNLYLNCLPQKCQMWYARVELEGSDLIFYAGVSNGEAAAAAMMGGAIGGAIIATKRYKYALNLETGELTMLEEEGY